MVDISQFDQEFLTAGSQSAEDEKIAGLVQQNLTPEEQKRLEEIMPVIEEFNMLMYKAQTGKELPTAEEIGLTNGQGVPEQDMEEGRVPQDMQNQQMAPPRPIEGQMPESAPDQGMQNQQRVSPRPIEGQMPESAPEMMAEGGWTGTGYRKTDINRILQLEDKPDWLERALDPSSPMTKDNESIRSATAEVDGQYVLFPTIRMVEGKLEKYKDNNKAYDKAKEKQDFIVLPARTQDEADLYSKALSNEIGKKRQKYQGMQMGGGVAAGPVGVVNEQSADGSGVADDVPAKSDGFVINAAAVRHAGLRDVNDMIQGAITYAKRQGMKLDFDKTPIDAEKILVSNGEVVIPDVIANIIGYDRLEKINKRGEKETEKAIQEEQQQPPAPQKPTQPVMRAAEGGQAEAWSVGGQGYGKTVGAGGQMEDALAAESGITLKELEEVRKLKEPDRELAVRIYEALTVPETGSFKDPWIRTQVIPPRGSTAYGPVQITKDLMKNPKYDDINDPYEAIARQRLINQGEKFAKFGNKDWETLLANEEITQEEANEAATLYEYGKSGDYVRDDRDKEDYKRYVVTVINKMLKELDIKDIKDKKKLIKFIRKWRGVEDKQYEKDVISAISSSEKDLDN